MAEHPSPLRSVLALLAVVPALGLAVGVGVGVAVDGITLAGGIGLGLGGSALITLLLVALLWRSGTTDGR